MAGADLLAFGSQDLARRLLRGGLPSFFLGPAPNLAAITGIPLPNLSNTCKLRD